MPEHTPAPTPSRSVYGFVLYLGSKLFFFLYLLWALLPDSWLEAINITYLPKKYWAVVIPIFLLTILATFAFFIYPSMNLCMTPNIDDIKTIKDNFSKKKRVTKDFKNKFDCKTINLCICKNENSCFLKKYNSVNRNVKTYQIPMVDDLCISDVSKTLYLN